MVTSLPMKGVTPGGSFIGGVPLGLVVDVAWLLAKGRARVTFASHPPRVYEAFGG